MLQLILEYLLLLFPLVWEEVTDYIRIVIFGKEDNHAADIPVRIAMCAVVGLIDHWWLGKHFAQGFLYSGSMFMLFDPILNLLRGRNFFHKGTNFTDGLWSQTPPHAEVLVRFIFLSVGYGFYYNWDMIF